jgi:putative ABC transport system permease protein
MKIPPLLGRYFSEQDGEQAPPVAIINRTMARSVWPDENPIGKRFAMVNPDGSRKQIEVIGVTRDVTVSDLFEPTRVFPYLPLRQSYQTRMTLHLRTDGKPELLAAAVQQAVSALDENLPVYKIAPLSTYLTDALTPQRLASRLISGFGLLALLPASIGLYGVMTYAVAQRTQEIGIRMAPGAQTRDVLKLIVRQGMTLASLGVALGLAASLALTRLIKGLLFGVSATDPLTFAPIARLLTAVALLACRITARRATKVDPMVALRCD